MAQLWLAGKISSGQTRGIARSRGRVYTASTSSMAATNALLAFGVMTLG